MPPQRISTTCHTFIQAEAELLDLSSDVLQRFS
jgi:hypothetical protein